MDNHFNILDMDCPSRSYPKYIEYFMEPQNYTIEWIQNLYHILYLNVGEKNPYNK